VEPSLAHSKGKPDVSSARTNINVRFAAVSAVEIQIRVVESEPVWPGQMEPFPFQITEFSTDATFE